MLAPTRPHGSRCKGIMTPHEAPLVPPIGSPFGQAQGLVTEELISAGALYARYLPALAVLTHSKPPRDVAQFLQQRYG